MANRRSAWRPATGPPSAALVHREFAPWEPHAQGRQRAPQCTTRPALAAEARREPRAATRRQSTSSTSREKYLVSAAWGGGFFRNLAVNFISYLLPGPCHRRSPWSGVERIRGKGLGDRLLLMPPSSTQSSPSPTLGSTPPLLPAEVHRER